MSKTLVVSGWLPWWVVGVCGSYLLPSPAILPWIYAFFILLVFAFFTRWQVFLFGCALCAGIIFALWRTDNLLQNQWPLTDKANVQNITLTVSDIPQYEQQRSRFVAQVKLPDGRQQQWLLTDYSKQQWPAGSRWQIKAKVRAIIGEANKVGFNREAWALANHISAQATVVKDQRKALPAASGWKEKLTSWRVWCGGRWETQSQIYPQGVALIKALTVGEQSALPAEAWQVFRPLGLNHLVSISGLHVGMLAMLAAWLCSKCLQYLPFQISQPWILTRGAAVITAIVYSALAGFAVPTQRSMLMIIILALTWRRGYLRAFQIWWLTIALVLLFDPLAVLSVGFWLSFLLVAVLMWAGEGVNHTIKLFQLVQAQWAAGLASVVLVAFCFGSVPVMSPLVNALAIPWFTLVLVPIALLSMIVPLDFLRTFAAYLTEQTMQILYTIAEYAPEYYPAHAPLALWLLAMLSVLIMLLPRGWHLRPLCLLILLLMLSYRPPRPAQGEALVRVWDVGQGLAVSISTAGHELLFDTGTAYAAQSVLLPNLRAAGIRQLDTLVLSHNDADHDGGAVLIKKQLQPKKIIAGQISAYQFPVHSCTAGANWQWDNVWFEFLNQPVATNKKGKNDYSCVLRVVSADKAVLITGDLGKKGEQALLKAYGDKLFSQILVLGHHGSRYSSDAAFIQTVAPQYAVASAGFANPYGHPHIQVQALLAQENISLLRTDRMGGIQSILSERNLSLQPLQVYKPYWQRKPIK
ncbi:DNA internalization-related competence protein ComEC/Rec2 [Snodgrassella alvi]|uniref:DNA internalization-related competence protein ComEC/Rec2 n=1 Tax=Snodgrassella alvi TaxID=1196083 RepID=UPI00351CB1E5